MEEMGDDFDIDSITYDSVSRRPPTGEMLEQEYRLFGNLWSGDMVFRNFSSRLKYQNRNCPGALWDEIFRSDNKEMYKEVLRKQRQRRLGRRYHRQTAERLGVIKPLMSSDEEEEAERNKKKKKETTTLTLARQRQKYQHTRLDNVSIHPCCIVTGGRRCGKNVTGTLEAHLNGFRYSNSCIPFEINVMYSDIKYAFTQDGDEKKAPFFHLHLHKPIMVGTEMTENIQFHMVLQTLERGRKKIPAHDSDKFEKELQNNKVMCEFSSKVDRILYPLPLSLECKWVDTKHGFYGKVHPKEHPPFSAVFVFSYSTLIQLEHTPFTVITLKEIEIVNLVQVGSGMEMFNMTIVFKDFERDVFQINSIPDERRIGIKDWLDLADVKYYENKMDIPDWGSKLEEIRDNPKKFIEGGGWKFLNVQESANDCYSSGDEYSIGSDLEEPEQTCKLVSKGKEKMQQYSQTGYFSGRFDKYSCKEPGQASDSDPRENEKTPLIQKIWTMEEGKRVMVSSDECNSDPEIKEREKKGTKLSTKVRRHRKLIMAEESGDEE